MKRCFYCGLENADEATICKGCGETEFEPPRPVEPPSKSHLGARLALGLLAGLIVTVISVVVAWNNNKDAEGLLWEQELTRWSFRQMRSEIEFYRTNSGHLPARLNELTNSAGEESVPLDPWHRPFSYSVQGTNYVITSFGRDGKPGGVGLDCDLSTTDQHPEGAALPLSQFLNGAPSGGMLSTCAVSGMITAALTILLLKRPDFSGRGLLRLALRLGATIIGAVLIAAFLAALHVPIHEH